MPVPIDHLVYAVPDLDRAVREVEARTGARAAPGGRHPGMGTRNALLALGGGGYLEFLGPDPGQPEPARRPFLDRWVTEPRLVAWAVRVTDVDEAAGRARAAGYDPGPVVAMRREVPGGRTLEWRLTRLDEAPFDGVVPFLIDWGMSAHPAATAPEGLTLVRLRVRHPDPEEVRTALRALDVDVPVERSEAPGLAAELRTPHGPVELR